MEGDILLSSFPIQFIILSVELKIAIAIQTKIHKTAYFVSKVLKLHDE